MAGLAFVVAEALESDEWQAEARFLVRNARSLQDLLEETGLASRGHPPDVSATVQTDLLFEEHTVNDHTTVTFGEFARLTIPASLEDYPRLAAWDSFMHGLEQSGRRARLVIWFVW